MAGKKKRAKGAKPKGSPGKAKAAKAVPAGAKARNGDAAPQVKPKEKAEPNGKEKAKEKPKTDLTPLKAKAEEAKKNLTRAENEANALIAQAKATEAAAKKAYVEAVGPYRDACRKAGVKCEFAGARAANKTPAVRFLVEKVRDGVKVSIKDRPETEEVIPMAALKESVGKAALAYTDSCLGPREVIGCKAAGLGNRIRAALKAK
ncbi:MAG: hypothetical protein ACYTKD_17500 [Planctomycetota bacterium]|jgi:hypothetical protein